MSSLLRSLQTRTLAALRRRGLFVYSRRSLPRNVDLGADLARFQPLVDFRRVVDVGANEGQTAQAFLSLFPAAEIVSFEPVPSTFRTLQASAANHPRIRCEQKAVSDRNGQATMTVAANSLFSRLADAAESGSPQHQVVTTIRLEDYLSSHGWDDIDLLKTDTEGRDLDVLRGCGSLLTRRKIKFVLCEVGFTEANPLNTPLAKIYDHLTTAGYDFYGLYDPRDWTHSAGLNWADALFVSRDLCAR